jgi:ATP-dependent DNA ligase
VYKSFPTLCQSLAVCLSVSDAVLDGEIGHYGKPQFYDLMRRRGPQYLYAFDLLWLNGRDHRGLPLRERKRRLREIRAVGVVVVAVRGPRRRHRRGFVRCRLPE